MQQRSRSLESKEPNGPTTHAGTVSLSQDTQKNIPYQEVVF